MSGFGVTWGGGWGGASDDLAGFWVASARASSSQAFIVTFSARPTFVSPIWVGDASNLVNVVLTNLDTGATFNIVAARQVATSVDMIEYVLATPFTSSLTGYRVTCANLVGYYGELLTAPKTADFPGMPATQYPAPERRPLLDLFNPQVSGDMVNGGLVVGSDGDYAKEAGTSFLRKLVIRRVLTAQSEFYHLASVSYGLGVSPKNTPAASDLVSFRTRLLEEISKEPEIYAVSVRLSLGTNHVLDVHVQATVRRTDQLITLTVSLPHAVQL